MVQGMTAQKRAKQLLRQALGGRRYRALSAVRRAVGELPHALPISLVRLLPSSTRVRMRSAIRVVQKLDYPAREIWLHVDSLIEQQVRLVSCAREPDTVAWIETVFRPGEVFYDIGANVGAYSLVASRWLDGRLTVYAFEPAFFNFGQLCRNVLLNRCEHSVIPLPIALSDRTGIVPFNYQNLVAGGALHALGAPVDQKGEPFTPVWIQPVMAYRLDDLIRSFTLPEPHHIKIDVDGIELEVLRGAAQTLLGGTVRTILVELHPGTDTWKAAMEFLDTCGFRLRSSLRQEGGVANHIFERSDRARGGAVQEGAHGADRA